MVKINKSLFKKKRVWIPLVLLVIIIAFAGVAWNYHDNPQFCGTCHIMDPYLESWESPPLLANAHSEDDLACLDCHPFDIGQSTKEVVVFVLGNYEQPLDKRKFEKEWCFDCHEHGSYEQIIEITEPMFEGVGRNPHNSHHGEIECYICHRMHDESIDFCSQCHDPVTERDGWITWEESQTSP